MNPFRNFWLQLFFFLLLSCLGLVILFYFGFNWMAARNYRDAVAQRKAAGRPAQWEDTVPSKIPPESNFCATPLLAKIYDESIKVSIIEQSKKGPIRIESLGTIGALMRQVTPERNALPSAAKCSKADLKEWAGAFAKSDTFPTLPPGNPDLEKVLAALELFKNCLQELHQAALRPKGRFDVPYRSEPKLGIHWNSIGPCIDLSQLLCLRATASVQTGRSAEAWADLELNLKICQTLDKEPSLISGLVSTIILTQTVGVIWEGLADQKWSPKELSAISATLGDLDYLVRYRATMEKEMIFGVITGIDFVKANPQELINLTSTKDSTGIPPFVRFIIWATPAGEYDRAKAWALESLENDILPSADPSSHRCDPRRITIFESKVKDLNILRPGNLLLKLLMSQTPSVLGPVNTI